MNRKNNVPFDPSAASTGAVPGYKPLLPGRVPQGFMEAMKRISAPDMASKSQPAQKAQSSAVKWKSSFQPIDKQDGDSQEKSTSSSERTELYDPCSPLSSDSEPEVSKSQECHSQDNNLEHQRLSPVRGSRWDVPYSESANRARSRREFSTETRPAENRGLSPGQRRAYSPDAESLNRPGYGPVSGPAGHRGCSPDRLIHASSTQLSPVSYGGQRTGEERMTMPEYRREMSTTVRLSPPRLKRDYQHSTAYAEAGLDQDPPAAKVSRNKSTSVVRDKRPITCDLCEVELANGKELEDHLDSKSHWDTLEHIQQNNSYDDMAIAFLQEVMLYKSQHCSRPIEDSALQALQENDHMTRVEMFHCAACKVFISTSAAEVQAHITSQEHLSNTKEFQVQQRLTCLSKAETMMKELKPQFEHFLKGGNPLE
ncbi:DBIRD complex subunit ZNF326 [Stegastes partitus]|uniref:DBIRD complex subunit ZNF326 n=1 Tax=Stegastes partitus TaxID=144197 RepID=A0A3B4ZJ09_9TELE|nr:PREDICTED: DBIRD complex subunit ZNF326 [Stegastes partitus]